MQKLFLSKTNVQVFSALNLKVFSVLSVAI